MKLPQKCDECSSYDGHGNECSQYNPGLSLIDVQSLMHSIISSMPEEQHARIARDRPEAYLNLMRWYVRGK